MEFNLRVISRQLTSVFINLHHQDLPNSSTPSFTSEIDFNITQPTAPPCIPVDKFLNTYFDDWSQKLEVQIIFICIYSCTFVAGVFSNLLIILAVILKAQLRSVRNVFIVALSAGNICICFTSLILTAVTDLKKEWIFGSFACKVSPLFQAVGISVSTFTLTCIALDRYILIVHPNWRPLGAKHAAALLTGIWTLAIVIALPSTLSQRLLQIKTPKRICEWFCYERWENSFLSKQSYSVSVLFTQFIIPLMLMSYWYARIAWKINRRSFYRQRVGSNTASREEERSRRIIRTVIVMYATFLLCWSLYSLLTLLIDFKSLPQALKEQNFFCHLVAHALAMTTVIWNPLLYGWANENFKRVFLQILPCLTKVVAMHGESTTNGPYYGATQTSICQRESLVIQNLQSTSVKLSNEERSSVSPSFPSSRHNTFPSSLRWTKMGKSENNENRRGSGSELIGGNENESQGKENLYTKLSSPESEEEKRNGNVAPYSDSNL